MAKGTRRHWYDSTVTVGLLAVALAVVTVVVVSLVNPWPTALLIRSLFERGAQETVAEMEPYVPKSGVDGTRDIVYGDAGADTSFDVFWPSGTTEATADGRLDPRRRVDLRDKDVDPYVQIVASHGYTTVGLNYTISPETTYPTALKQLNPGARLPRRARGRVRHRPRAHRARGRLGRRAVHLAARDARDQSRVCEARWG